ncbi:uncharacterized protein LOC114298158 isoform X2 [Camellia sinensis]|uniref:uncharacterized protein LOC114298158 isoform X2 n=1 Tax=Camellia sinensis TaxID=4442 RepID=UPI001036224A|nr:uncharacterized protein LOC114298158 isoform X2 [Camellia sinensis]
MVGRKDTSKRVFDTWIEIFQKRKVKRERKSTSGCSSISNEFDFLHSMISNRYRTMLMEKMDILWSWHNKILPHISRHMLTKSFVEDTISLLLHILSPPTLRAQVEMSSKFKTQILSEVYTLITTHSLLSLSLSHQMTLSSVLCVCVCVSQLITPPHSFTHSLASPNTHHHNESSFPSIPNSSLAHN